MADADVMGIRSVREIGIAVKFLFVVTEHALAWGAYPNISFLVFQYGGNPGGDGLPFIGLSVQERKYVSCRIVLKDSFIGTYPQDVPVVFE